MGCDDLRATLDRLQDAEFPVGAGGALAAEIGGDLAEYDGHVAGVASSVLSGDFVEREWLSPDTRIRNAIEAALSVSISDDEHELFDAYRTYLELVESVLTAAERCQSQALGARALRRDDRPRG